MRLIVVILCATATAHAGTRIVLMAGPDDVAALRVALAGRGAEIATGPEPDGALRLDRAAIAQRSALDAHAIAGVWIESEPGGAEVCVVSADGKLFRHAPLPIESSTPRVFAAIATSLLDEVIAPAPDEPGVTVDVHVDVMPGPDDRVAVAAPMPPGLVKERPSPRNDEGVVRANRTLLELGPMLSPFTAGIEGELAFPLTERVRVGALVGVDTLLDASGALFLGAVELRHVGRGDRHIDLGVVAGSAFVQGEAVPFAGIRFEHVWEGVGHGVGLSLTPVVAREAHGVYPGIWTSLRWELPI